MVSLGLRIVFLGVAACALLQAQIASTQALPSNGRFSLFANWSDRDLAGGGAADFSEVIATLSIYSEPDPSFGLEFGIDTRPDVAA